MPAADKMAGKGTQSPFYVSEASVQKKKSMKKPKPASGMVAALQNAKSANRTVDSELKAMQARIAALQAAEADADMAIQRAKNKADRILSDRSAANQVDYVQQDEPSTKAKHSSSVSGVKTSGKRRPPSNPRPRSTESDGKQAQSSKTVGTSDAGKRSSSLNGRRKETEPLPVEAQRRASDPPNMAPRAIRSMSVDRQRGTGATTPRTSDGRPDSGDRDKTRRASDRHEQTDRKRGPSIGRNPNRRPNPQSSREKNKRESKQETSSYIHPALLDESDSDDDDGPTLAEALGMPGLSLGMSAGHAALDGLLERYDKDEAMPLQDIVDAAAEEMLWMDREEARLCQATECGAAAEAACFGCVSEVGAGAWG